MSPSVICIVHAAVKVHVSAYTLQTCCFFGVDDPAVEHPRRGWMFHQ